MGVDIRIDGGVEWNASDISVSEDSTPLDPSDTFGGVGSISFVVPVAEGSKELLTGTVEIDDSSRGTTTGVVDAIGGDRVAVKADAMTRLSALVADRTALPHVGTLDSLLLYYFGLCDITTGIVIDASVGAVEIVAPGWYGEVWAQVKKLASAYQFEVATVGADIVVRPPRQVTATRVRESSFAWSLDRSDLAQTVEAWYYPVASITDALVVGNELAPISNLDAGEVHEFDVRLSASLSSVDQPVAVDAVSFDSDGASEYSILDASDVPVDAEYWRRNGGHVTVEIGEDTRTLHVTVVGCHERARAPYRLVGVKADGFEFSTLRIVGSGVSLGREKYTMPAAIDAAREVGAEVDNDFLTSWGHAHLVMLHAARRHGGTSRRIRGSAWHVAPGAEFEGQQYGNVAGSRIFEDFNVYRIRAATLTPSGVSYEAEVDTTFADTNDVNSGHTIADWNALWSGRPIDDFNLRPLTPIPGGVTPPPSGLYPGTSTFPSTTTFPGA